jgi:hypothetical protein
VARTLPLGVLEQIRIASPCSMRWEDMRVVDGDRVRHCAACKLHVYNLSGMSRAQADALVLARRGSGARFCVRLYQRADGTVLTRDCPVGLRSARLRLARAVARVAAALAFLVTGAILARSRERMVNMPGLSRVQPFATVIDWIRPPKPPPAPGPPAGGFIFQGTICG